ncbi:hypothetical protein HYO65_gp183 [Tenacibaculum phage PTm1]|uniref:Uncharacterized protein n=2 Tax=Shirahamavirus PTm1 TaxID=2846435 RepID=A0A5S9EQK3_9CAUD|nr:hypothetical protein HYO65_gp183 [Tenacibaculum phage PTm1]BBI90575.1 hypothetical protein [Tenacibaculum phage PTm1]BBI90883.1 hypothetical protein [Tenacibaculum phage PTm5]
MINKKQAQYYLDNCKTHSLIQKVCRIQGNYIPAEEAKDNKTCRYKIQRQISFIQDGVSRKLMVVNENSLLFWKRYLNTLYTLKNCGLLVDDIMKMFMNDRFLSYKSSISDITNFHTIKLTSYKNEIESYKLNKVDSDTFNLFVVFYDGVSINITLNNAESVNACFKSKQEIVIHKFNNK